MHAICYKLAFRRDAEVDGLIRLVGDLSHAAPGFGNDVEISACHV
jgi:hypothetical protein